MDGSQTTRTSAEPCRFARACGAARRRQQLRLWLDPVTRAAAARLLAPHDQGADAFAALYLRYAPYVAAIGGRVLGRCDEVDDLVQEVLLRALQEIAALPERATFKRFLAQLALRSATRRLRACALRMHVPTMQSQRTLSREVYDKLDMLPPQSRALWVLRHVRGESLHAIAQRTGCSLACVQRCLSDAQTALEARFVQDYAV